MKKLFLSSHNQGKINEFRSLFAPLAIEVVSPQDGFDFPEPEETGTTFQENAWLKALASFRETGIPSIADDSGLVVPALGGEPGVYSARYAGVLGAGKDKANRDHLLQRLREKKIQDRTAYFHCSIAFVDSEQSPIFFEGQLLGEIQEEEAGQNGFGYDPIFWIPSWKKTLAQMSSDQKNQISHRGKAMQAFWEWFQKKDHSVGSR